MTVMVYLYLFLMSVGVAVLVTMPIWAGWWKPKVPSINKGQRRGKRRLRR